MYIHGNTVCVYWRRIEFALLFYFDCFVGQFTPNKFLYKQQTLSNRPVFVFVQIDRSHCSSIEVISKKKKAIEKEFLAQLWPTSVGKWLGSISMSQTQQTNEQIQNNNLTILNAHVDFRLNQINDENRHRGDFPQRISIKSVRKLARDRWRSANNNKQHKQQPNQMRNDPM